jgi:hypothetical protein
MRQLLESFPDRRLPRAWLVADKRNGKRARKSRSRTQEKTAFIWSLEAVDCILRVFDPCQHPGKI